MKNSKEYQKKYYKNNKDKVKHATKKWYNDNKDNEDFKIKRKEYRIKNKEYYKQYHKEYRKKNRDKILSKLRKQKYGVTDIDIIGLIIKQKYECPICRKFIGITSEFHVDHCHETGMVRGLLHPKCNLLLGKLEYFFKIPIADLFSIVEYANQHITTDYLIKNGELEKI